MSLNERYLTSARLPPLLSSWSFVKTKISVSCVNANLRKVSHFFCETVFPLVCNFFFRISSRKLFRKFVVSILATLNLKYKKKKIDGPDDDEFLLVGVH